MKKILTALVAVFTLTSVSFAGQVRWDAGDFTSTFANGTGYLCQVTTGTTTIAAISDYIANKGLTYTGTEVTIANLSSGIVIEDDGDYYINQTNLNMANGEHSNLFLLVLSQDQKSFALYEDFKTISGVNDVTPVNLSFGEPGSLAGWSTGSVANVPEPTALALLALGVAGVALRRRKMA